MVKELIDDGEIEAVQNYANNVSIVRLGYNDHGPVHMRTVCRNALKMLKILHQAGIKTSLETEQAGTFSDSVTAVILVEEVFVAFTHSAALRKEHLETRCLRVFHLEITRRKTSLFLR